MGIFGYADDNFLIAPSLDSLQEMLATCQEYATEHNLKFSTQAKPVKFTGLKQENILETKFQNCQENTMECVIQR